MTCKHWFEGMIARSGSHCPFCEIEALKAELAAPIAQPVQEPVGYTDGGGRAWTIKWSGLMPPPLTLYVAPLSQPYLTDEQIDAITVAQWGRLSTEKVVIAAHRVYARAVEAAVKGDTT